MRRCAALILTFAFVLPLVGAPASTHAYEFGDRLSIGGRIFADAEWRSSHERPRHKGGTFEGEFRRVRLFASGTFEQRITYKLQFDFAGGDAALKDAYVGVTDIPVVGTIKAGHFKEPFSLEELTSSKYILATERAMITDAFTPGRNTGIAVGTSVLDQRATWQLGAFREADKFGRFVHRGGAGATGRLTGLPWRDGDDLVHLGVAYSHRVPGIENEPDGPARRLYDPEAQPESHLAPVGIEVPGDGLPTSSLGLLGIEALSMVGPTTFTAEAIGAGVLPADNSNADTSYLWGWNAAISVFLSGEGRPYDTESGTLARPRPDASFAEGGPGAWEVVARVSQLDFRDVGGESIWNTTAGVNWYLHGHSRLMLNYGVGNPNFADERTGELTHIVQSRLQLDF